MRKYLLTLLLYNCYALASQETAVQEIELASPLNQPAAEISGLGWCDDNLLILPQYPKRLSADKKVRFFTLKKKDIIDTIKGEAKKPLEPQPILVNENRLRKQVTIFDGYEAIACQGNTVWLSIEAINLLGVYHSYLVPGRIDWSSDTPSLNINTEKLWSLNSQSKMRNIGDEAILLSDQNVISLHEVNDPRVIKHATANVLDRNSGTQSNVPFPSIPYRITDASKLDDQNRFWAINYKYSGDKFSRGTTDPLSQEYGEGESHKKYYNVERLLEFELRDDHIRLTDRPPLQLKMEGDEGRNWEGLVRLDKLGFLLATDKHPKTIFGFVPLPGAVD